MIAWAHLNSLGSQTADDSCAMDNSSHMGHCVAHPPLLPVHWVCCMGDSKLLIYDGSLPLMTLLLALKVRSQLSGCNGGYYMDKLSNLETRKDCLEVAVAGARWQSKA